MGSSPGALHHPYLTIGFGPRGALHSIRSLQNRDRPRGGGDEDKEKEEGGRNCTEGIARKFTCQVRVSRF